jgi:orotate phosphoribosyltransferase
LRFGEFRTKAGRISPYFFDAGCFFSGPSLNQLAQFYARRLLDSGLDYDMLFGLAYKGITLVSATAVALAALGKDLPFGFNRKEVKAHGEGGSLIGAPIQGRVVIVDDVISAGVSLHEASRIIRHAQATPMAVLVALDRMEKIQPGPDEEENSASSSIPRLAIANIEDMLYYLSTQENSEIHRYLPAVAAYRERYGA